MMAQVLQGKSSINKMMINWAESKRLKTVKQLKEDVLDAMTQYRVEERKLLSSLRTSRATGQPRIVQAVTIMLREDDLDEAKETAETKGELSRERA